MLWQIGERVTVDKRKGTIYRIDREFDMVWYCVEFDKGGTLKCLPSQLARIEE